MNKQISTIFLLNEAVSLLAVKPLHCPFCQLTDLLSETVNYDPQLQAAAPAEKTTAESKHNPLILQDLFRQQHNGKPCLRSRKKVLLSPEPPAALFLIETVRRDAIRGYG
jgi:hypothetical protein